MSELKGGLSGVGRDIFLVSFRLCRVLKGVNTVHILDRLKTRETMKFKLKKRPKLWSFPEPNLIVLVPNPNEAAAIPPQ